MFCIALIPLSESSQGIHCNLVDIELSIYQLLGVGYWLTIYRAFTAEYWLLYI